MENPYASPSTVRMAISPKHRETTVAGADHGIEFQARRPAHISILRKNWAHGEHGIVENAQAGRGPKAPSS